MFKTGEDEKIAAAFDKLAEKKEPPREKARKYPALTRRNKDRGEHGMEISKEQIVAMAVAAVAEMNGTEPKRVVVHSFKEIKKTSLEQYIADNNITYHKYQLEDARA